MALPSVLINDEAGQQSLADWLCKKILKECGELDFAWHRSQAFYIKCNIEIVFKKLGHSASHVVLQERFYHLRYRLTTVHCRLSYCKTLAERTVQTQ